MSDVWIAFSENLPAIIVLIMFLAASMLGVLRAINKRDQTMTEVFSRLLEKSQEDTQKLTQDFIKTVIGLQSSFTKALQQSNETNQRQYERITKQLADHDETLQHVAINISEVIANQEKQTKASKVENRLAEIEKALSAKRKGF